MQAFAALQHAYTILQRHGCQSAPTPVSTTEAEQAASSQHNRLLLQAYEVPHTCWHLLPPHLQAGAAAIPCKMPFLAFQLDTVARAAPCGYNTAVSVPQEGPEALTAAHNRSSHDDAAVPLATSIVSGFRLDSSVPDAAADAAAAAASSESPCESANDCHSSAVMSKDIDCVTQPSMQRAQTSSAGTACRSFETSTRSHGSTVVADPVAQAMHGPACTAGSAGSTWSVVDTCKAGVGISQMESTDTLPQPSPVSTSSSMHAQGSCQGLEQTNVQGQWQGSCHEQGKYQEQSQGQGHGQGRTLLQMALLVPCRKAVKDRFPLNGTFFQVNEVFLDHNSMEQPLQVMHAVWQSLMNPCQIDAYSVLVTVREHLWGRCRRPAPLGPWPLALQTCAFMSWTAIV